MPSFQKQQQQNYKIYKEMGRKVQFKGKKINQKTLFPRQLQGGYTRGNNHCEDCLKS